MANKIEFNVKNGKPFIFWLKRFSIDNSLLLEIDEKTSSFIAKATNEERSIVKFSSITFEEAGIITKASKKPLRIKVGIYHIPRLIKILELFGIEEYKIILTYDEVKGETVDYAGTSIVIKNNKDLNFLIECAPLSIFKYISDELFINKIAITSELIATFDLTIKNIEKINSLCNLNDDKFIRFFKDKHALIVSDKYFSHLLHTDIDEEIDIDFDGGIDLFKKQFESIDAQNYRVKLGTDRMVFKSNDGELTTVLSMVEKTEKDEEKQNEEMKF
jgi:hypothetical protein